ncbi:MAG: restriction endonuclease subunit S [Treponema sp.]|nr:restriction endonuclease subunit S [Treponema sp.]
MGSFEHHKKQRRQQPGKIDSPLNEKLKNVKWGEFRVEELFELQKVTNMLSKEELSDDFEFPAYSSDSSNNGIIGFTNNPEFICDDITPVYITFGDHTRTVNIAKKSFSVLDNVKVLKPFTSNEKYLLFIISSWKKQIPNLGYARHWKAARNCKIQLPLKENALAFSNPCDNIKNIDFDFMESFIRELEEEHIRELNAYLLATGLKDYTLTPEEENALEAFKTVQWEEFELPEIFDIKNTHNILSSEIVAESGTTPYLCASAENNGVSSYISYKNELLENGNCIFIGGKTFVVSYQKDDFYSNDSHNLALYLKEQNVTKSNQLYLATCIRKGLSHKYSWGDSISGSKIKSDKFQLPTKNNKPDYATMETFIKAVEKLVIKDVVLYADSKIKATKNVVKKDFEYKINEDAGLLNVADSIN